MISCVTDTIRCGCSVVNGALRDMYKIISHRAVSSIEGVDDAWRRFVNKDAGSNAKNRAWLHPQNLEDYEVLCGIADMYIRVVKYSTARMLRAIKHDLYSKQKFECTPGSDVDRKAHV